MIHSPPDLIAMDWKLEARGPDAMLLRKLILGSSSWFLLGAAASAADLPAVDQDPAGDRAVLGRLLSRRSWRLRLGPE